MLQKKHIIFWAVILSVPWTILVVPFVFYQPSYEYDVLGASIFAAIGQVIFAAGIGTLITGFASGYGCK